MSDQDDLMAELRGEKGVSVVSDPSSVDEGKVENPMETNTPDRRTAVQKADSTHSVPAGGKGYAVKVSGTYYAPAPNAPGRTIKKNYEVTVNVPRLEGCKSVIKENLITPTLEKKFGTDFVSVRTCSVVDVKPLAPGMPGSTDLRFMTREQLVEYVHAEKVPINLEEYGDTAELRDVVIEHRVNPKGFEKREEERRGKRTMKSELRDLNPGL